MDFFTYEIDTQMMKNIKNINLDIIMMLLESFNILCDSEQGYYKYSNYFSFYSYKFFLNKSIFFKIIKNKI